MTDHAEISVGDFATQKTRILSRPCDTCITRPAGERITVPNRIITNLIRKAVDQGDYVVCHATLPYVNPAAQPAVCRGFADTYDTRSLAPHPTPVGIP